MNPKPPKRSPSPGEFFGNRTMVPISRASSMHPADPRNDLHRYRKHLCRRFPRGAKSTWTSLPLRTFAYLLCFDEATGHCPVFRDIAHPDCGWEWPHMCALAQRTQLLLCTSYLKRVPWSPHRLPEPLTQLRRPLRTGLIASRKTQQSVCQDRGPRPGRNLANSDAFSLPRSRVCLSGSSRVSDFFTKC